MRAADSHHREAILQGALLVVDSSLTPVDGSLLICAMEGEYRIKRYRKYPRQHLEDLSTGKKEALPVDDDGCTGSNAVFGVITHVINDARSGEFDCKRKLTAVCSHQTRIGNLDAHLTQTDI